MDKHAFLLYILVISCVSLLSSHGHVHRKKSTEGKEFMLAFSEQYNGQTNGTLTLYIGSYLNSSVRIRAPSVGLDRTYSIGAGMNEVQLDPHLRGDGTGVENKGILVQAHTDIAIHALDSQQATTDGYMALPLDVLSTKYYVVSYSVNSSSNKDSQVMIVAPYDNTKIMFHIKSRQGVQYHRSTYYSGDSFSLYLNRFQTFQLEHASDLTGTKITSSKPVAVFTGNRCANVPNSVGFCDHLIEQMVPVSSYGSDFIVPALWPKREYILRVLSAMNGTEIHISRYGNISLNESQFVERSIQMSQSITISSSKPVLVVQYSKGHKAEPSTDGDPFMTIVPAVSQYAVDYSFSVHRGSIFHNYLVVTIQSAFYSGLLLDGRSISPVHKFSVDHSSSNGSFNESYTILYLRLAAKSSHIEHSSGNVRFGAILYGFLGDDSYGYPLGLGLKKNLGPETRLIHGSKYAGRLEVFYSGQWGTICDDGFDVRDANVICTSLGFPFGPANATVQRSAYYGMGSGPIAIDDLNCNGDETSLYSCSSSPWMTSNCSHSQDVGVDCGTPMRLAEGPFASVGRIEILHDGEWGTVCNDTFGKEEADVACRVLGFHSSGHVFSRDLLSLNSSILLSGLDCYGSEQDIALCMTKDWGDQSCDDSQDVFLRCANTSLRLSGGSSLYEGRVEVWFNGSWSTVCDDKFDNADALVICRTLNLPLWSGSATYHGYSYYGEGDGDILVDDLQCEGIEKDLVECPSRAWLQHDCKQSEEVGVDCRTAIRLVGGSEPWKGRLEVFVKGVWGTVCDDYFDNIAASVACRMLGYQRGIFESGTSYSLSFGTIWLDDLRCTGVEADLTQCMTNDWGQHNCKHSEDVHLICESSYQIAPWCYSPDPDILNCTWYSECFAIRYPCGNNFLDDLQFAELVCSLQHKSKVGLPFYWLKGMSTCLQESITSFIRTDVNISCGEITEQVETSHKSCFLTSKQGIKNICDLCFEELITVLFSTYRKSSTHGIRQFWDLIIRCHYTRPAGISYCGLIKNFTTIQMVLELPNVYKEHTVSKQAPVNQIEYFPTATADDIASQQRWSEQNLTWFAYFSHVLPIGALIDSVPISIVLVRKAEFDLNCHWSLPDVRILNATIDNLAEKFNKNNFTFGSGLERVKMTHLYWCNKIECDPSKAKQPIT